MSDAPRLRASYSILTRWAEGDWKTATEMYFRLTEFNSPAMEQGKKFHEAWENEVNQTNSFPKVFGGRPIRGEFETELKIVKKMTDWFDLVGVIDLWIPDELTIVDWKSGVVTSSQYANGFQPNVYHLLKPEAKRFEIHRYDQYNKRADMSIGYLTDQTMSDAVDWVVTFASEMHSYFVENGLYERFGNRKPSEERSQDD